MGLTADEGRGSAWVCMQAIFPSALTYIITHHLYIYAKSPLHLPTSTMALKTKRTRSRFGCNNCKRMKIKCDECKPQCGNCLKSKKYFNKCDYSLKLSWGGRPYKNESRKRAMKNCGYNVGQNILFVPHSQGPFTRTEYQFIDESASVLRDYNLADGPELKRRKIESECFLDRLLCGLESTDKTSVPDSAIKEEPDSDIDDAFRYDRPQVYYKEPPIDDLPVSSEMSFPFFALPADLEPVFSNFLHSEGLALPPEIEVLRPGLRTIISAAKSRARHVLGHFTSATVDSVVLQVLFPTYQLEKTTANQYLHRVKEQPFSNSVNEWNLLEKKNSLMGIENFFTQFDSAAFGGELGQILVPFAELDDFWRDFSNPRAKGPTEISKVVNSGLACSDVYSDVYSIAPTGIILLDLKLESEECILGVDLIDPYGKDSAVVYDRQNKPAYYYISKIGLVSLVPYPDLLMNVSYYRELFHFYIHCVSDMLVNYNDRFYDSLTSFLGAQQTLVAKNPFKYQLPAIAFAHEGVLLVMLALSAAFKQFKANFENLSLEDVGRLRKSTRTFANLKILSNCLSRYNYHKPVIQNLILRAFAELTSNIRQNDNVECLIISLYLITYLERVTSKRLSWKLLDLENDLVFTALDYGFHDLETDLATVAPGPHSNAEGVLGSFTDYLMQWFLSMTIFSGCLYKAPKVNQDQVYEETVSSYSTVFPSSETEMKHQYLFGLHLLLLGELFEMMQLSLEKCQLICRFRDSREEHFKFREIFNNNSGVIRRALKLKNKMVNKMNLVIEELDSLSALRNGTCLAIDMLKITSKLYTYSALLILYRRVVMVPRDSEIAQKFAKEILNLVFKLWELNGQCLESEVVTMFNGCSSVAVVCAALETLDFQLKEETLLRVFELSKRNFSLNAFLVFEIIQESYENGLPLSEIVSKRGFMVYFS